MTLSSTGQRSSSRAASKTAAINITTIARKESRQANDDDGYNDDNGSSKKRKRASTSSSSSSNKKAKKLTPKEKTELKAKRSRERMSKKNTMCINYSDEQVRNAQEEALQKSLKLVKALKGNANGSKFILSYQPTEDDIQTHSAECQSMASWMRVDIALLHQYDLAKRIDYSDKKDPEHMSMDRKCHITLDGYHPPGIDSKELHFHVMNYEKGLLGCNGGCGSNDGKGYSCTYRNAVEVLRKHVHSCQDRQARGNKCQKCDAKCDSPLALKTHDSKCESDEVFNANLEKVRRLLPPPGQKWKSKLGFLQKVDRNLFEWVRRKVEGSRSIGPVGGERRKKLEALGYTEKRGFFQS